MPNFTYGDLAMLLLACVLLAVVVLAIAWWNLRLQRRMKALASEPTWHRSR